jgi:hypothetical protein
MFKNNLSILNETYQYNYINSFYVLYTFTFILFNILNFILIQI